jgi:hypothetical protein
MGNLVFVLVCIFILSICGLAIIYCKKILKQAEDLVVSKQDQNYQIAKEYDELKHSVLLLHREKEETQNNLNLAKIELERTHGLIELQKSEMQSEMSRATANYADTLDEQYNQIESDYLSKIEQIEHKKSKVQEELDKMRATQDALIEARRRKKETKDKQSFYCLPLTRDDASDIQVLETVKARLSKPRVLSMLIWSTYFQKPMTALCNNVLGTKDTICGIYKITNIETDECYIGQAVDIATRWKNHAKCGLDIDRPIGNKLYQAMRDYGIQNFSWELLEKCNRSDLDAKEKYYIGLYNSCNYGYNSNIGNS